jgi:hypothetical protein
MTTNNDVLRFQLIADSLIVTEIMYGNRQGELDLENGLEFLEFKNVGSAPLDLSALFVQGFAYDIDAGTLLLPGHFFTLARIPALFQQFYGVPANNSRPIASALANGGERISLLSARPPLDPLAPQPLRIVSLVYDNAPPWPVMADDGGFSLVARDPTRVFDLADVTRWRVSAQRNGSPGRDDPPPSVPELLVNELLAYPSAGDLTGDFVEILNPTAAAVDLDGWTLTDALSNRTRYIFPPRSVVGAFDVLVANASTLGFGFSSLGDSVYLLSRSPRTGLFTGYSHGFGFRVSDAGRSYGRVVNGVGQEDFVLLQRATPGAANAAAIAPSVAIVEINYNPPVSDRCKVELDCEFVRLRNVLTTEVSLFDAEHANAPWRLTALNFTFPAGVTLEAGAELYVTPADPAALRTRVSLPAAAVVFGPAPGVLSNAGETISLTRPIARPPTAAPDSELPHVVVDTVTYDNAHPWPTSADGGGASLHRCDTAELGNDASNWNTFAPCVRQTLPPTPALLRARTPAPVATPSSAVGAVTLETALIIVGVLVAVAALAGGLALYLYRRRRAPTAAHTPAKKTHAKPAAAAPRTRAKGAGTKAENAAALETAAEDEISSDDW